MRSQPAAQDKIGEAAVAGTVYTNGTSPASRESILKINFDCHCHFSVPSQPATWDKFGEAAVNGTVDTDAKAQASIELIPKINFDCNSIIVQCPASPRLRTRSERRPSTGP